MAEQVQQQQRKKSSSVNQAPISLAFHLIEYYFRIGTFINAVPFKYDKRIRRVSLDKQGLKYKIWVALHPIGMLFETHRVIYELVRSAKDPNTNAGETALILFVFFSWCFISACHINCYIHSDAMVTYINQGIQIREYITEAKLPPSSDGKIVRGHLVTTILQWTVQSTMVATEGVQGKGQYIYSMLPVAFRTVPVATLWICYAYYRVSTNFLIAYWGILNGVFHVMTCNQILQYRIETNMTLDDEFKTYRMLQLLCNHFNDAYAGMFLPSLLIFAACNIIEGNFGALRFYGMINTDLYVNFPLMAVMMMLVIFTYYPKNATIKEVTDFEKERMYWANVKLTDAVYLRVDPVRRDKMDHMMIDDFDDHVDVIKVAPAPTPAAPGNQQPKEGQQADAARPRPAPPTMAAARIKANEHIKQSLRLKKLKRYAASCPSIAVKMGSFYGIKKSTVLNVFDFIICNTISALLTWK